MSATCGSRRSVSLLLVVVALVSSHAVPALSAADAGSEVLATQAARFKATIRQDLTALDRIIGDDLVYVHTTGKTDTKAQYLAVARTGRIRWQSIEPEQTTVKIIGDVAILSGRVRSVLSTSSDAPPMMPYTQYVEIYVKRDGRWQLTHIQSTRLDGEPASSGPQR